MRINMIGKISNFQVYRHLFNENNISKVQSHILGSDGSGRTVDDVKLSVLKAIYENFEREELFNPRNVDKHSSILTIDKGKIINSDKSHRFSLLSKHEGHEMCDSSGVAAGQNSKMAIEHSFYEFIERQSLVYSFLTGRGGTSLKSLIPKDKILKKLNRGAYYINDISIVDNISVIIIIFSNTLGFSIGLGTDKDQKKPLIRLSMKVLDIILSYFYIRGRHRVLTLLRKHIDLTKIFMKNIFIVIFQEINYLKHINFWEMQELNQMIGIIEITILNL